MNRKQFLLILGIVLALVASSVGVAWWKRTSYEVADTRVGQKLVAGFTVDEIAGIRITDAASSVTLVRGERGWTVKERDGFPADFDAIRDLLLKVAEQKVVQTEGLSEAIKPRLQLAAPGAGGKPAETGVLVDLTNRDGKSVAQMVLGKRTFKPLAVARAGGEGIPTGRYVWVATDNERVNIINEPFSSISAQPQSWLARELMRVERIKAVIAFGPDGKEKWSVFKDTESGDWKLAGPGKLDAGKAQDAASAFYGMQIADVAVGTSDAAAGLDRPTRVVAQTFDGWGYELAIGKLAPADRYYARSEVTGKVPESRSPAKDEKPEDKEKADKAFAERKEQLAAQLERDKALSGHTVLMARSTLDPLLRERSALLATEKPREATKKATKK